MVPMKCHEIGCHRFLQHAYRLCSVYNIYGMEFRQRQGYCPIIDKYFNPERQKVYEQSKNIKGRSRVGQQKQRKR